jgi:hypothetical protein
MRSANPWGENWHNENHSSAEMDSILDRIFGAKLLFMGFEPAGKRKWTKSLSADSTSVVELRSDRGFIFYAGVGVCFPWIPHAVSQTIRWHKTPQAAHIDLRFLPGKERDWSISKSRALATDRANRVSEEVCGVCEDWLPRMKETANVTAEILHRSKDPLFHGYVHELTVFHFWMARSGKWDGMDEKSAAHLTSYFGEAGFIVVDRLLKEEAARFISETRANK